jgi:uncharacterized protein (TIGR02271 family)
MEENRDYKPKEDNRSSGTQSNSRLNERVIPVVHEYASVNKEVIETGKVRIRKTVSEEKASVNLPVLSETYQVEYLPGYKDLLDTPPPAVRYEGDTMIIPVLREVSVVVKKYEVVEEIHITRRITETPLVQEITLLKEHVDIERIGNNNNR